MKTYTCDSSPCLSSFTSMWILKYVWCKHIAKTFTFCKKNNSIKWVYRGGLIHEHVKTYVCHICACDIREVKLWFQNVCSPADALELNTILQHNMKLISNVYALFGRPLETILTLNSRPSNVDGNCNRSANTMKKKNTLQHWRGSRASKWG